MKKKKLKTDLIKLKEPKHKLKRDTTIDELKAESSKKLVKYSKKAESWKVPEV